MRCARGADAFDRYDWTPVAPLFAAVDGGDDDGGEPVPATEAEEAEKDRSWAA
jgi:hypothetical protein